MNKNIDLDIYLPNTNEQIYNFYGYIYTCNH